MREELLLPLTSLDPKLSLLAAALLGWVLPSVLLLVAAVLFLRHTRAASERKSTSARPLDGKPGPAVLFGKTVWLDDFAPPLRLMIDQQGSEWIYKGQWRHKWSELSRRTTARPFAVQLEDGRRVRVVPGERLDYVDQLTQTVALSGTTRRCVAELSKGEPVWVAGELRPGIDPEGTPEAGYRQSGQGLVMVAPDQGPLVVSTEPLHAHFERRALWHSVWIVLFLLLTAYLHLALFWNFERSLFSGQTAQGIVADFRVVERFVRSNRRTERVRECLASVRFEDPGTHRASEAEVEVGLELCTVRSDTSLQLPVRLLPGLPMTARAGREATLAKDLVAWVGIVSVLLVLAYADLTRRTREWWARGKLVHEGPGKLRGIED